MRQNLTPDGGSGISIRVPVPAMDSKLYASGAIDEILLFLIRHRFDQFTQRELARQVDHSESTVRRAVAVLAENELVEYEHEGNKKLVRINRSRISVPNDPILHIPQEEFHEPVKDAIEQIETNLDSVVGIVLYGSVARGEADRRSDVDLWVLVDGDRAPNQREANMTEMELEEKTFAGQRYDFHIAVESVDSVPAFADEIRRIVRTGIPVYTTETFQKFKKILVHEDFDE